MTCDTHDLAVSRFLDVPVWAVWQSWAQPELMRRWMAPAPVKAEIHRFDFRPGGAYDYDMIMPDGVMFRTQLCFLQVERESQIVFTDALRGGWRPASTGTFTAYVTMESEKNGTRYTARVAHRNEADRQLHARTGFIEGWGASIDELGRVAAELT